MRSAIAFADRIAICPWPSITTSFTSFRVAPHLTEENHRELLSLAKHRTKREVLCLVRKLAPEPSVPDRIEPLDPESVGICIPRPPTWRHLVESLAAGVRELPPGDRPKDWVDRAGAAQDVESGEPPTSPPSAAAGLGSDTDERYKVSSIRLWARS